MIVLANDDGKKMVERDGLDPFLEEYAHVTGTELKLIAAGERLDFIYETSGRRHDLEVVRAMQNPLDRSWNVIFGRDGQLHGLDAAILVQDVVYRKEQTRASTGWRQAKSTILFVKLIRGDGEAMAVHLDDQVMDERWPRLVLARFGSPTSPQWSLTAPCNSLA